jgi:sulfatase modifying factor 1
MAQVRPSSSGTLIGDVPTSPPPRFELMLATVLAGLAGCQAPSASALAGASCATVGPGTSRCGENGENCCASPLVSAGNYGRTYVNDGDGATSLGDPASVSAFRLDRYLITVGRFRQFVSASLAGWTPSSGSGKHTHLNQGRGLRDSSGADYEPGWVAGDLIELATTSDDWAIRLNCDSAFQTWTDSPGPNEALPLNCIDWYEAYAFCIWDGGFLPSESEWEYAAAGGSEQRAHPWGSTDPRGSSRYAISGCNYPPGSDACSSAANLAPVGTASLGAGRWGQLDLAGDLAEWTLDWYAPYAIPCVDCVNLTDFSYRVIRGGSFGTDTEDTLPSARDGDVPPARNAFHGARCARAP